MLARDEDILKAAEDWKKAGRGVAQPPQALLYGMAHALWLARPEHVIGGVLAPKDAADLVESAQLAFAQHAGQR